MAPTLQQEEADPRAWNAWEIVQQVQAGDAEAFGLIYDRYIDQVFKFIYYRTSSRELAEDLTADTFYRALKRIGTFTWQGRDFGTWLITIARNLVADHHKSGRARYEMVIFDEPRRACIDYEGVPYERKNRTDEHPEGRPDVTVADHLVNLRLIEAVRDVLTDEQREVIILRFILDLSVTETAAALGKNSGMVKALQYRALRRLRRNLPDLEGVALAT